MNSVKNAFSIRDLENLSGIKAHTIRIWEKRYHVFSPSRSGTNIRSYTVPDLQKLLNIALLHKHGYKISKISKLPEENIPILAREIMSKKSVRLHAIAAFKLAMMNFDQKLFLTTYNTLLSEKPFSEIFYEVFIPLLDEIGMLWQTGTITPAHEHFISALVRQKILINTEQVQVMDPQRADRTFILFLPMNEVHELGLLYLNYEIQRCGYRSIYLGENVPVDALTDIKRYFDNITYVSYFTVEPAPNDVVEYLSNLRSGVLNDESSLLLLGKNTEALRDVQLPENIRIFGSVADFVQNLQ